MKIAGVFKKVDRLNNPHFSLDLLRKSEPSQFSANLPRFCSQKVKKIKKLKIDLSLYQKT